MRALRSVVMVLLVVSLVPATMLAAQATSSPSFVMRPGVIVDPSGQVLYMMHPGGGIDAVEVASGRSIWHANDAAKPLSLAGDLLVALADRTAAEAADEGDASSSINVVMLNATTGRTRRTVRVTLPAGLWPFINDGPGRSLHVAASATPTNVLLSWSATESEPGGIDPDDLPELSIASVAGRYAGRVRINVESGRVDPVPMDRLAAQSLAADQTAQEAQLIPNVVGAQYLSADGRHVLVSEAVADDNVWEKYRWRIYTASGRLIGEINNAFPQAPFFVSGNRIVFEARPFQRRADDDEDQIIDEPLKLRTIDLGSKKEVWNRALRDTTFYGPFPESDAFERDDEEEAAQEVVAESTPNLQVAPAVSFGGTWSAVGPAPLRSSATPLATPNNENVGCVHTLVPHPTNANILWAGAVNGGIWKTTNASAARPNWTQLTDPQVSLSIGALVLDPADTTNNTLVAGIGRFSSYGRRGGARTGLLRSTDGGTTWTPIDGGGVLVGKNISSVAVRGARIVVSVNITDTTPINVAECGLYRSTDGGATFTQISQGNGSVTGLPGGITHDLGIDPVNPDRLFTGVFDAALSGGVNGVYRSTNGGATWTKVSNAAMDALILDGPAGSTDFNMEFVVSRLNNNVVYALIVNSNNTAARGKLAGVFRSGDGGTTWVTMDTPNANPGSQGFLHLAEAVDPGNTNLLYLAGDTATFRCNAAAARGSQCTTLQGSGTASGSSPHPDHREFVFDAAGLLLVANDGGVWKRTSPANTAGDWFAIGNNIQAFEAHSMAYDTVGNTEFGGFQDNGTGRQENVGDLSWRSHQGGDGGDVAIDAISSAGLSSRYSSSQNLGGFRRSVFNASNVLQSQNSPALTLVSGAAPTFQFTTPVRVNNVDGRRILIGGSNGMYESLDQGGTIRQLLPAVPVNANGGHPLVYGATGNANVIYFGSTDTVFVRTVAAPSPLVQSTTYPGTGTGRTVIDMAINLDNGNNAFAVDTLNVYMTQNAGTTWTNITGNLLSFNPGTIRSVVHARNTSGEALVVGTNKGAFAAVVGSGFTDWGPLGTGMANAPVYDLDFDRGRNVLVAGTLGRGTWRLNQPSFSTAVTIFNSTFDANADGFTYVDDAFGTNQPNYASGTFTATSGFNGGGLQAVVGGVDDAVITNMSGGWRRTFSLASSSRVSLTYNFNLTMSSEYEADENTDALSQIDAQAAVVQATIVGNGNGGNPMTTGNVTRTVDLGCLAAGNHTLTLGLRNNKKTLTNESTTLLMDNVLVQSTGTCP